ncbi:MAG TPA: HEAT repeat domain-containing protein [Terriglobales bacterium]|jgi:anti-sigma factor RsiW|nr:HEAT repeat domain-containing protein [Terriglobales bacterium]
MKCEWVRENILLFVYNELPDDARYELEQHVARCGDCAGELKATRVFHATLSSLPVEEPTPNLLTASRMRLQEALETTEQGGLWQKLTFDPWAWLRQMRFSPALSAALLIVGFAAGIGTMYSIVGSRSSSTPQIAESTPSSSPAQASISGIRSIIQEPGSDKVSIKYDATTTQQTEGSINDQRIQQLLLFAARNNYNSGVRMDSVDLLTQKPDDTRVREALLYALRYDSNPGVRLKALEGLSSYVKDDVRVRDTLLEALMNDSNAGVRTRALQLLEPVRADSSVRAVLQRLAQDDKNVYIRSQARTLLAQLPEID